MKKWITYLSAVAIIATCGALSAAGQQNHRPGFVVVPESNSQRPEDIGVRAHTNFLIFVPTSRSGKPSPQASSPGGETPSSLACVYQVGPDNSNTNCPKSGGNYDVPTGGSNVIAIVDAYDYPTACSDFNTFSGQFGLPKETNNCINQSASNKVFNVVYASGSKPRANCGWAQEEALDIEWAHAMAPNAKIILVEAASNSNSNLLKAIQVANNLVSNGGGGQISMSWGGGEFSSESSYDTTYFSTPDVTYFASSGDTGGTQIWPSVSANVISAGGTSVNRDSKGNFTKETVWSGAGGGPSKYVPAPLYQDVVSKVWSSGKRGTPDISFDADPYTGVSVFDSTSCQGYVNWMVFGGTSVSSPSLAGIANASGAFSGGWDGGSNGSSTVGNLYSSYNTASNGGKNTYSSPFFDVTSGSAGSYSAGTGWDYASGIGTVRGTAGFASSNTSSAPTISSFSPTSGPVGTSVTISGSGFTGTSSVTFNGTSTSAQFTVDSGNQITATVPSGATSGPIIVTTSAGTATSSTNFDVTTSSPPSITSFSPTSGPVGTSVTISGSGFTGTSSVTFNGTSAQFTVDTTNQITATVPSGASTGVIAVTTSAGTATSSTSFTVTTSSGSFSLSATPPSATISPKSSTSFTITVNSSGFSGSVSLTASAAMPQGRASFSSNPVTVSSGGTATTTLTVSAGPKTPTNTTYTITVTGTSGTLVETTSVQLTVQ